MDKRDCDWLSWHGPECLEKFSFRCEIIREALRSARHSEGTELLVSEGQRNFRRPPRSTWAVKLPGNDTSRRTHEVEGSFSNLLFYREERIHLAAIRWLGCGKELASGREMQNMQKETIEKVALGF